MIRTTLPALMATGALLFMCACAGSQDPPATAKQPTPTTPAAGAEASAKSAEPELLDRFASYLTGRFDSKEQADADKDFFAIQLWVCPITAPELGERVLYVEQAAMSALDKPYRQRLYVLESAPSEGRDPRVRSRIFTLADPGAAIGLCERAERPTMTASDAQERVGCAVTVAWDGTRFQGSSDGKACPSKLRGASHATVEVTLDNAVLESWDRGYDQSDKQVWGAEKGPYRFVRRTALE